ncbi:MAG: SMI1/KNR4 family protein [Acidobacteriota bacterium]
MNEVITRMPGLGVLLNKPCTASQITQLESALNCVLPEGVRLLYQHHDGMKDQSSFPVRMMSAKEVIETHSSLVAVGRLTDEVRVFWIDEFAGNYMGIYVTGLLKDKICYLDHEEIDFSPVYRTVESFYAAGIDAMASGEDWYQMAKDYPILEAESEEEQDSVIAKQLLAKLEEPTNDENQTNLALCVMNILPMSQTHRLFKFAESNNMWIQERACELLGKKRITEAIPLLSLVARNGTHNGRIASMVALRNFNTVEADKEIATLINVLGLEWSIYLRRHNPA